MDEKSRGKVLDLGLMELYEQAATQAAQAHSTSAQSKPTDECIPEFIDIH